MKILTLKDGPHWRLVNVLDNAERTNFNELVKALPQLEDVYQSDFDMLVDVGSEFETFVREEFWDDTDEPERIASWLAAIDAYVKESGATQYRVVTLQAAPSTAALIARYVGERNCH
jgi:hypothetical protein